MARAIESVLSGRSPGGKQPSKQEEVPPAKRASIRQKEPVEHLFDRVPHAHTSKIYRSAVWTASRKHTLQYRNSSAVRLTIRFCRTAGTSCEAIPE
jgi:hypothetical protein